MFVKLGIIAVILVAGGLFFSSEISNLFPNTSASITESVKTDISNLGTKTSNTFESKIDEAVIQANEKINSGITDVKESSTNFLSNELTKISPLEGVTSIFDKMNLSNQQ